MNANYYNPTTRRNGTINETELNGMTRYICSYEDENGVTHSRIYERRFDADTAMAEMGFYRQCIIDADGAHRYCLPYGTLVNLYKNLEDFIADCTKAEYEANKDAINAVNTLIHKHINAAGGLTPKDC